MVVSPNDPRIARCAFAKLEGDDGYEYFICKYDVYMGRRSKSTELDIVLGADNMNISRKHAGIHFNFLKGGFELVVLGKSGVTVSGVLHTPATGAVPLRSGDHIALGDRSFYFLLPAYQNRLAVAMRPMVQGQPHPLPIQQQQQPFVQLQKPMPPQYMQQQPPAAPVAPGAHPQQQQVQQQPAALAAVPLAQQLAQLQAAAAAQPSLAANPAVAALLNSTAAQLLSQQQGVAGSAPQQPPGAPQGGHFPG